MTFMGVSEATLAPARAGRLWARGLLRCLHDLLRGDSAHRPPASRLLNWFSPLCSPLSLGAATKIDTIQHLEPGSSDTLRKRQSTPTQRC